jgi:hypothetical protein
MDRHARQARLAGVGAEGQARIARACADVALTGFGAEVAARYLAGAGVGRIRVREAALAGAAREVDRSVDVEVRPELDGPPPTTAPMRDPVARELAEGALAALAALRSALEPRS